MAEEQPLTSPDIHPTMREGNTNPAVTRAGSCSRHLGGTSHPCSTCTFWFCKRGLYLNPRHLLLSSVQIPRHLAHTDACGRSRSGIERRIHILASEGPVMLLGCSGLQAMLEDLAFAPRELRRIQVEVAQSAYSPRRPENHMKVLAGALAVAGSEGLAVKLSWRIEQRLTLIRQKEREEPPAVALAVLAVLVPGSGFVLFEEGHRYLVQLGLRLLVVRFVVYSIRLLLP